MVGLKEPSKVVHARNCWQESVHQCGTYVHLVSRPRSRLARSHSGLDIDNNKL